MDQDSGTGSELTASFPSVTILTDGPPGPAGIAARGHDDARVIPVADAMSEGLPPNAIVAVSDTNTVVAVLDLFQSTAAPDAVIRLVMVDSLGITSPDLLAVLALFDVTTIDTRAACPILTLRRAGSGPGSAVRWSRQLSQAQDTVEVTDRPLAYTSGASARERAPSVDRPSGPGRSHRAAEALVAHPIVPMIVAAIVLVMISFLSISSFPDRPAAILLSMVFGILLLGIGGLVLASLLRSRRFGAATARAQRSIQQSSRRIKSLEDQVRGLRSAIAAATSTMGAATAATNELLLRPSAGSPHQGLVSDPIMDQLREELSNLKSDVALIDHKLSAIQEGNGR